MEKINQIRKYLQFNLSHGRYQHSVGVEQTSIKLAQQYSINEYHCALAGLSHDICREIPLLEFQKYSNENDNNLLLHHGYAGSILLKEKFHISNISVLNAVKYHTSGSHKLDDIGKIVYVADFLEPGRKHLNNYERERLFQLNLDDMVLDIALQTKSYISGQGKTVEKDLDEMILELQKGKIA